MDANLQRLLINAGNEAKKRSKIEKLVEEKNKPVKENVSEQPARMSRYIKPWTDEELVDMLNKANAANANSDIRTLTNMSSDNDILKAALSVLTAPTTNDN